MRQLPLGVRLRDRAVFESFLPGENLEAVRHLEEVAAARGTVATWICGPPGSGKSHLLQAVCARASRTRRAGYFPLREALPLGIEALEGWNALECLCLDDVEAIAGERAWEQAIFQLYRDIEEQGGRFVAAAASPPALLQWALPDLGSRLRAGAVYQLRELDEAGRVEALRLRARLRGLELPEETVRYLQRRFPRDMGSLYGLLDALDDAALAAQRRLTVPFVRGVLGGN
jgi:DnaA family protein